MEGGIQCSSILRDQKKDGLVSYTGGGGECLGR